nr:hypothetical protein [uncultured bacterium]
MAKDQRKYHLIHFLKTKEIWNIENLKMLIKLGNIFLKNSYLNIVKITRIMGNIENYF